jgi:hypothetical protein
MGKSCDWKIWPALAGGNLVKSKRKSVEPIEETVTPAHDFGLGGPAYDYVTVSKGIVTFTSIRMRPEELPPATISPENTQRIGLTWQSYSELQADHGEGITYGILFDEKFGNLFARSTARLLADIGSKLKPSIMVKLNRFLDEIDDEEDATGGRKIFTTAVWAEMFSEKYSEVWLAAMAQHAYYVEGNSFAFGYMSALLDKKASAERDFLRGKVTANSAGLGGKSRSSNFSSMREAVLAEMERLIGKGFSRANAARMTKEKGLGTSQAANEKLWGRHHKK